MSMQRGRVFQSQDLLKVAERFGTPFFLYDPALIRQRIWDLRNAFSDRVDLALSVKANPNPHLLRALSDDALWFDVASIGELQLAMLAGISPRRMLFIGPGKTVEELKLAIELKIGLLVAESAEELRHIDEISKGRETLSSVLLRVNPSPRKASARLQMTGTASQFGISIDCIAEVVETLKALDHVQVKGVHCYFGSQILDAKALVENFQLAIDTALSVCRLLGKFPEIIDIGGGFGVPYFPQEKPIDMVALRDAISYMLDQYTCLLKRKCLLLVESGRYVFAEAGVYVCSVLYNKRSHGVPFLVLDGGSNFNGGPAGVGKIFRANFPIYSVSRSPARSGGATSNSWQLAGPLCTPLDLMGRGVALDHHLPGDLIVFENAGAYGLTFSQERFLSHTSISEVLWQEGNPQLIKRRKTLDDFVREYDF